MATPPPMRKRATMAWTDQGPVIIGPYYRPDTAARVAGRAAERGWRLAGEGPLLSVADFEAAAAPPRWMSPDGGAGPRRILADAIAVCGQILDNARADEGFAVHCRDQAEAALAALRTQFACPRCGGFRDDGDCTCLLRCPWIHCGREVPDGTAP